MLYLLISLLIILTVLNIVVVAASCKISGDISRVEERVARKRDSGNSKYS